MWFRRVKVTLTRQLLRRSEGVSLHTTTQWRHSLHPYWPSSTTRRNYYDAARALACTRRRSDVTRCTRTDMPAYGRCANRTSSRKPEVHNVWQHRQRRSKRQPSVTCTKIWGRLVWLDVLFRRVCLRTDRQTYRQKHWHAHHKNWTGHQYRK